MRFEIDVRDADDSSDDESSRLVTEHVLPDVDEDWSEFTYALGVQTLYAPEVSAQYYVKQKPKLGRSYFKDANEVEKWVKAAVTAAIKSLLNNSHNQVAANKLTKLFFDTHQEKVNCVVEQLLLLPDELAKQSRETKTLRPPLQKLILGLQKQLKLFLASLTDADFETLADRHFSIRELAASDYSQARFLIDEAVQFCIDNGLMRDATKLALAKDRQKALRDLDQSGLALWQKHCVKLVRQNDNANVDFPAVLGANLENIFAEWLKDVCKDAPLRARDADVHFVDFTNLPDALMQFKSFANRFANLQFIGAKVRDKGQLEKLFAQQFPRCFREQKIQMRRATLKSGHRFSFESATDYLASIRLAMRDKRRRLRQLQAEADGREIRPKVTNAVWQLCADDSDDESAVSEQQKLTNCGSQVDFLPEASSYENVAAQLGTLITQFNDAHPNNKISEVYIAMWILALVQKQKFIVIKKGDQRVDLNAFDGQVTKSLRQLIINLTCLLFVTEVQRHPAALVMHLCALDLIRKQQLTFAAALSGADCLPMALKDAVQAARSVQDSFGRTSFHAYRYAGDKVAAQELRDLFEQNESRLIKKWLTIFAPGAKKTSAQQIALEKRVQSFFA